MARGEREEGEVSAGGGGRLFPWECVNNATCAAAAACACARVFVCVCEFAPLSVLPLGAHVGRP